MMEVGTTEEYPEEGWMFLEDMSNFTGAVLMVGEDWEGDGVLSQMQHMVDGLIEYVPLGSDRDIILPLGVKAELLDIVVNEEGLYRNDFDFNPLSTLMANGTYGHKKWNGGPFNLVGPALVRFRTKGEPATVEDFAGIFADEKVDVSVDEMGSVTYASSEDDEVFTSSGPNIHFAKMHEASLPDEEE